MSYKVLARKWRPQQFTDMIGQEHVLRALVNALDNNRLHHAYLFTGMRGVGKTTVARIFAKCLNCLENGVSSSPCGRCSVCRDIEAGSFLDLIEVDAASRTKVDETRELLENVPYLPGQGRFKVYLIDEVHMFSNHSFNALLKTLEEPPEHVKFLLATTDPQKLPVTVLSRCLQFNLKRMSSARLVPFLAKILAAEDIEAETAALDLIARAADGSVRDSLSLVEQATAFGEGAVRRQEVEAMLGRVSVDRLLDLLLLLAGDDTAQLFAAVEALDEYGPDYALLLGELVSLLHHVALLQSLPGSLDPSTPGYERLTALADSLSAEQVQLNYQIGVHARRDMPFSPDPREAFDMALLRMRHFAPQLQVGADTVAAGETAAEALAAVPAAPSGVTGQSSGGHAPAATAAVSGSGAADTGSTASGGQASAAEAARAATLAAAGGAAASADPEPQGASRAPGAPGAPTTSGKSGAHGAAENPGVTGASGTAGLADAADASGASGVTGVSGAPATPGAAGVATAAGPAGPAGVSDAYGAPGTPGTTAAPGARPASTAAETPDGPGAAAPDARSAAEGEPADFPVERLAGDDWATTVERLGLAGMPLQLAQHCVVQEAAGKRVVLQLHESQEHLRSPRFVARLETALSALTGRELDLTIEFTSNELDTPARQASARAAADQLAAEQSIESDPLVKQLLAGVNGTIDPASVQPINRSDD